MKLIENEYYYHIQRAQTNQWEIGKTYFIGKEKNEFVSHFDTTDVYCPNDLHQSILTLLNKNEDVPNDMLIYTLNNYLNVSNHYKKLAREYVFEEVRADFFPNLPSRQKCLWVMPVNEEILSYWWQYINGRIL
ncbi:DUF2441 domain-containing protein [Fictibacillus sp. JL2B1089]|uniref:DUF2441 domain-containing protein n=1 Tax=Fictibacillus sp. JL2B1089 TaxID=3399565 RepID=UPI003A88F304